MSPDMVALAQQHGAGGAALLIAAWNARRLRRLEKRLEI